MNEKEMLLIFPPQWTPVSPHFAIPSLLGQLKSEGFNATAMDLNIEFFDYILNPNKIQLSLFEIKLKFDQIKGKIATFYSPNKKEKDYTFEQQILFYNYSKIKAFLQNKYEHYLKIPSFLTSAKNTFKTDGFYDPVNLIKSLNVIDKALEIVSLPYSPTKVEFDGVINPFFKFNYESIKYFVLDKDSNIFADYYEKIIQKILDKNAGLFLLIHQVKLFQD